MAYIDKLSRVRTNRTEIVSLTIYITLKKLVAGSIILPTCYRISSHAISYD